MHVRAITRAALAALLALCLVAPADAQVAQFRAIVVASCGSVTLPLNDPATPYMDRNGVLCTTAGASGGGAGATGSVTPAGTSGTSAQAIQGITGGVPVPVTGTFSAGAVSGSMEQDVRSSGTLNAASTASTIVIPVNGQSTVGLSFTGLTASGATVTYEQSNDGGTTYTGVNEVNAGTGVPAATRTADGQTRVAVQGRTNLRLRISTAGTGTVSVAWTVSVREGLVTLASPLPPGTNAIGTFGLNGPLPAGTNAIGTVTVANPTSAGSVTAPGTTGTAAQAVQGVAGGVPQNSFAGQYNATLPTLATGQSAYLSADSNGRLILSNTSALPVTLQGGSNSIGGLTAVATNGGVDGFSRIVSSAATNNATVAKASSGRLYKIYACNTSTSPVYIRFFNLGSAPVPGTNTVAMSRVFPPAAAGGLACTSFDQADLGWTFSVGIAYVMTTGAADNDNTALAAGQIAQLSVEYK